MLCWPWGLQQYCCGAKLILFCFKVELPALSLCLGIDISKVTSKPLLSFRQTFSLYPCLLSAATKTFWFIKVLNKVRMPFPHSFHSFNSCLPLISICSLPLVRSHQHKEESKHWHSSGRLTEAWWYKNPAGTKWCFWVIKPPSESNHYISIAVWLLWCLPYCNSGELFYL